MAEVTQPRRRILFGPFELDLEAGEIRKRGVRIGLPEQAFRVLEMLLDQPGEIVTRDQLKNKLWSAGAFGDFDHGINKAINKLREALNDSASSPRYVETIARRGYRFIGEVTSNTNLPAAIDYLPRSSLRVETNEASRVDQFPPAPPKYSRGARIWAAAAVAVIVSFIAGLLVVTHRKADRQAQIIRSLAVLPLENLSSDASQEYFADGMTDDMITALGTIGGLRVISRSSVMLYKHVRKPLPQVAHELGVDAVLEGTVLRAGSKVRITTQLVRAATDEHLWTHSYEGDLRDILQLQDSVARTVADTVRIKITSQEQALLSNSRSINPDAQDAYLRGRFFWNKRTGQALDKAVQYFNRAVALDPKYAEAYSGLADSYALLGDWEFGSLSPAEAFPKAESAAARALEIDDGLGAAHASLALCLKIFDWKWQTSEAELIRAIQLNPSYASAHQWYGWLLILLGDTNKGIKELRQAASLDPLSLIIGADLADALLIAHRYEESVRQSQSIIEMDPSFGMAYYQLAQAHAQTHKYDEAVKELEQAISLSGRNPLFLSHLGYVHALAGKQNEALQIVGELQQMAKLRYLNPADVALIYVGLNRKDQAFAWLDRAFRNRFNPSALSRPAYDPLRSDPRYEKLLKQIGLVQ